MLTAREIESAKPKAKPAKLFDGRGLFLLISPAGKRNYPLASIQMYRLQMHGLAGTPFPSA